MTGAAPIVVLLVLDSRHGGGTQLTRSPENPGRFNRRAAGAGDPGALTFLSALEQHAGRYAEARGMLERAVAQDYMRAVVQLGRL